MKVQGKRKAQAKRPFYKLEKMPKKSKANRDEEPALEFDEETCPEVLAVHGMAKTLQETIHKILKNCVSFEGETSELNENDPLITQEERREKALNTIKNQSPLETFQLTHEEAAVEKMFESSRSTILKAQKKVLPESNSHFDSETEKEEEELKLEESSKRKVKKLTKKRNSPKTIHLNEKLANKKKANLKIEKPNVKKIKSSCQASPAPYFYDDTSDEECELKWKIMAEISKKAEKALIRDALIRVSMLCVKKEPRSKGQRQPSLFEIFT